MNISNAEFYVSALLEDEPPAQALAEKRNIQIIELMADVPQQDTNNSAAPSLPVVVASLVTPETNDDDPRILSLSDFDAETAATPSIDSAATACSGITEHKAVPAVVSGSESTRAGTESSVASDDDSNDESDSETQDDSSDDDDDPADVLTRQRLAAWRRSGKVTVFGAVLLAGASIVVSAIQGLTTFTVPERMALIL
jgi:hypothetical protein